MNNETKEKIIGYIKHGEELEDIMNIFEDEATAEEIGQVYHEFTNSQKSSKTMETKKKEMFEEDYKPLAPVIELTNHFYPPTQPTKEELLNSINSIREEVESNCLNKGLENIRDGIEIGVKLSKLGSDKAVEFYQSLETHIYYYMTLQFEPKEIRAIIMKDFKLKPEEADKMFNSIENTEPYQMYVKRYSLRKWYREHYAQTLSDPYYVTRTPKKENPMKKVKIDNDDDNDDDTPQKFDISTIDDISKLKGQLIWFQRKDYSHKKGTNINYQIFSSGKNSTYSTNFFLHQDNVKTILETFDESSAPKFFKGLVVHAKEFQGGRRFGLGKETLCVGLRIEF